MALVSVGARLHFGFQNLSLARDRLYGGIGVGLSEPRVTLASETAETIEAPDPLVQTYAERATDLLDVPGVSIELERRLPRHVGVGSGTQLALSVLAATAAAYGIEPCVRERAPAMGRGGRSAVGVATFEDGGFVVDAGHPTRRFTTEPPTDGAWTVPQVVARQTLPSNWRFLVVVPDAKPGRSGEGEDASMRSVVERADPTIADEIASIVTGQLLPAAADGCLDTFGDAVAKIGRKNGAWYADAQGGIYRPPVGDILAKLDRCSALSGVGQSSWGPTVYGVTEEHYGDEVCAAGRDALDACGLDGTVLLTPAARSGARIESDALERGWSGG